MNVLHELPDRDIVLDRDDVPLGMLCRYVLVMVAASDESPHLWWPLGIMGSQGGFDRAERLQRMLTIHARRLGIPIEMRMNGKVLEVRHA